MKPADGGIVFGVHAVSRVIDEAPQRIRTLFLQRGRDDAAVSALRKAAGRLDIAVVTAARERLSDMAGSTRHQGVVAVTEAPPTTLDERGLAAALDAVENPLVLALDGVQDPHNLGACLRSAEAAGVTVVIVPRDRAVGLTGAVRKVASGAAESVPIARVTNLARTLRLLADRNIWRYGAAAGAGRELYDMDFRGPLCLVLGGEAKGLRRLTREHCDELFHIPMNGEIESLNVSVAAGICLFEALRQRRLK